MAGADVISHLIEIEKRAAEFMHQAHVEADARLTKARTEVDSQFKEAYEKLMKELEADYTKKSLALKEQYEKDFNDFVREITETPQDTEAIRSLFLELLDKRLIR
jgi:vacuolar-type H+-ATPase subunit H